MLKRKVLDVIRKYNLIQDGEGVVVGLSGGPDSVCLLHVLKCLSEEMKIKLYAVHINHMLRGNEAEEDVSYIRELCNRLEVELHIVACDIKKISKQKGISLEEAGREVRYREFESYAKKVGAAKIAVAHNKNDQAETVIMRIIRGTGLDGLKGMEHKRDNIIRPLLDIERGSINAYCWENSLNPRTDSSNLESIYTRNRIRLELIPNINTLFDTDIISSIYKMSLLIRDDYDFIENCISNLYNECIAKKGDKEVELSVDKLKNLHIGAFKRVLRSAVREVRGDLKGIENVHIESIAGLVTHGKTGAFLHLPGGLRVKKSYNTMKIYNEEPKETLDFEVVLKIPGETKVKELKASILAEVETVAADIKQYLKVPGSSYEQFFDYEKLNAGINIRNRRTGDIFKPLNSNGTKKLKEYLIDNKIPSEARDKIPMITKDNEIIWIVGNKINDKFKVTENTKSILKLKYILYNMQQ